MELKADWKKDIVGEPWRKQLLDAAEIIRQRGLAQGTFMEGDGRICTLGAIGKAVTGQDPAPIPLRGFDYQAMEPARRFAKHAMNTECVAAICDWNNTLGRTANDVIAALEACARM